MSDWEKIEQPIAKQPADDAQKIEGALQNCREEISEKDTAPEPFASVPLDEPVIAEEEPTVLRVTQPQKKNRRRYRFAAPIGLLVILLSITGVVSLIALGVNSIRKMTDDTELITELEEFLSPVLQQSPVAFTDVNNSKQDALILSAIWKLTDAERIRQMREKDDNSIYPMDDNGRMIIPVETVEAAYASIYGEAAVPYHHTMGGEPGNLLTTEYNKEENCYYVPYMSSSTLYTTVSDKLTKKKDIYTLRIGFVPSNDLQIDEKGNDIPPTVDMASHFQLYTIKKNGNGWMLVSIEDEKP